MYNLFTSAATLQRVGLSVLRASVASAALLSAAAPVYAQQTTGTQTQMEKTFDIAPQTLGEAIALFGLQTGIQISVDPTLVQDVQTPGVNGTMTVDSALQVLLSGTNLDWQLDGNGISIFERTSSAVIELPALTITGEKVERSYQKTLTSVGVATAEDIRTYKLDELSDAFNTMANVRNFKASKGNKAMQIRGVSVDGVSEPANASQTISVIVDGVAQSSEALRRGSRGTWDMKQVEVLRGPQSTLHGQNSLAGAIIVESNDPTYEWEAAAQGVVGHLHRRDAAVMISGPIVENQVAFRFAAEGRNHVKDIAQANPDDNIINNDEYRSFRGKVLIEPNRIPELSITLMANDVFDQPATSGVNGADLFDRTFNSARSGTSSEELRRNNVNNVSAKVLYDLSETLTIASITSVIDSDMLITTAPGNFDFIRHSTRGDNNFAQDLRLNIEGNSKLTGTIGLYYAEQEGVGSSSIDLDLASFGFAGQTLFTETDTLNETRTAAAYTDLRYAFDNGITLIGGGRIQHDRVSNFIDKDVTDTAGGLFVNNPANDITFTKDADNTENFLAFMPKLGLTYDVTDNQTVGVMVSRGYRQGFTQVDENTNTNTTKINPEYVWTTELSWRDQSIDGVIWGANVFYNDYQDQQISVFDNPTVTTFNVDGSWSYGAELEGRADFGNGFSGYGAIGFIKTELGNLQASQCDNNSCEGNDFPEAPAVTASLGATYQHMSGFFASGDVNYTDEFFSNSAINNDDTQRLDDIFLTNIRMGYSFGGVTFTAFVDNVFDKEYLTSINSNQTTATIGDGRTFGLQLDARF